MVKGLELKFLLEPVQKRVLKSMNMSKEEKMLVEQEIQELLRKGYNSYKLLQERVCLELFSEGEE